MHKREHIYKIVGICESGEIIMIDSLHWNGVSCSRFDYLTAQMVEYRNDIDEIKDTYSYLWVEAVANNETEKGLGDYIQELIDSEVNGGRHFFAQDDGYIHHITDKDKEKIKEVLNLKYDIECFECVGGGTGIFSNIKWKHIFDQKLIDKAIVHEKKLI